MNGAHWRKRSASLKELDPVLTADQWELERKLEELSALESELAQRELDLATLKAELDTFEQRFIWIVGIRYAELHRLKAEMAELQAHDWPENLRARAAAFAARRRAEESHKRTEGAEAPRTDEPFQASQDLKDLYRQLAKQIHPDLVRNVGDQRRRNAVMAEVNMAYAAGDAERLQAILDEWKNRPEAIESEDIGERLIRVLRMIARGHARIEAIGREIERLMETDNHELMLRAKTLHQQGRDLLLELAERLDRDIESTRRRLARLRTRRNLRRRRA